MRSTMNIPAVGGMLGLVVLFGTLGCGEDRCTEDPSEAEEAPIIEDFELLGQLQGDPWTLIFAVTFFDLDGDLSGGEANFYLNGVTSNDGLDLSDVFLQAGLAGNATRGQFAVPLRFSDTVDDGASVWLALQLADAEEKRSNCYALELDFEVETLALRFFNGLRRGLATLWPFGSEETS